MQCYIMKLCYLHCLYGQVALCYMMLHFTLLAHDLLHCVHVDGALLQNEAFWKAHLQLKDPDQLKHCTFILR